MSSLGCMSAHEFDEIASNSRRDLWQGPAILITDAI
jgi:hypothetical protein